jgi:hypothetical protein
VEDIEVRRSCDPGLDVDQFFLTRAFNAYQARVQDKALVTFAAWAKDAVAPDACLTIAGSGGHWTNPVTGAFGGLALASGANPASVSRLAGALTDWLGAETGTRRATLRLAPDCFADASTAILENALFRCGWRLLQIDLDQYLPVVAGDVFASNLTETKQKELRRLKRSGARFVSLPSGAARPAYEVIALNRVARGFPMTMTWAQIEDLAAAFPDRVTFHAVERDGGLLAGAVLLSVTASYQYVFYWGEAPLSRRESPVVLLAEGLVHLCHGRGASILDIGASTEDSTPNPGLFAFKQSLGCRTAAKRTYRLDFDAG